MERERNAVAPNWQLGITVLLHTSLCVGSSLVELRHWQGGGAAERGIGCEKTSHFTFSILATIVQRKYKDRKINKVEIFLELQYPFWGLLSSKRFCTQNFYM